MSDRSKEMIQKKRDTLVLQVGVGLETPSRKKSYVTKTSKMPRKGSTNRRRLGYGEERMEEKS
jgi:hypothetical protein